MSMRLSTIAVVAVISITAAITIIAIASPQIELSNGPDDSEDGMPAVSVSQPQLVDPFGRELTTVQVDERILIQSEIRNNQNYTQPYVYVVQVKNSEGITTSLSFARSLLFANDTSRAAQSWVPTEPGEYEIEVFVWDSVEGETVLSPIREISVMVEG